jgi:uncharacterized protein
MSNKLIINIKKIKLKPFTNRKYKRSEAKVYDGIFYKVEKDGRYFYVGGSIHVGKNSKIRFNELVEKAFEDSAKLAVEIDTTNIKNLIGLAKGMKNISFEQTHLEDKSLEFDYFQPENKTKYENLCKDLGLNPKKYSKLSPSTFYLVAQKKCMKKAGYKSKCGIDDLFIKKAKKNKKEIISLETPAIQLDALMAAVNMSPECLTNVDKNIGSLESLEILIAGVSDTHDAVFEGNISKLVNEILIYNPLNESDKEHLNTFLYRRNEMMVSNIESLVETGEKYFVVVGAAHVIGKGGLLKLFKEKGYTITRLK